MGECMSNLVNKLVATGNLSEEELTELLQFRNMETTQYLFEQAKLIRQKKKGGKLSIWGRLLISNYCKYDCKMCGMQRQNRFAKRYRMSLDQILRLCHEYQEEGIHHFLLESGDDLTLGEEHVAEIILAIRAHHPHSEIILALGDKTQDAYRHWKAIGVTGYLFPHGSANEAHFKKIYPSNMSLLLKKQHQWQLRQEGFGVGDGILVGLPYQTVKNVVEDMQYMKSQVIDYIDIRTFVPAPFTAFARERSGNGEMAAYIMAILRLMLPNAGIIADATLDSVLKDGRMYAIDAGADILLVDKAQDDILNAYCAYPRQNGRTYLGADDIDALKMKLRAKGLQES